MTQEQTKAFIYRGVEHAVKTMEGAQGEKAYKLSFAEEAESGASFGVFQNDVRKNGKATEAFEKILEDAELAQEDIDKALKLATTKGVREQDWDANLLHKVDAALSSEAGRKRIDALDRLTIDQRVEEVALFLKTVNGNPYGGGVFDFSEINGEALATMASWANRVGDGLAESAAFFKSLPHAPTIEDVDKRLSNTEYFGSRQREFRIWRGKAGKVGPDIDPLLEVPFKLTTATNSDGSVILTHFNQLGQKTKQVVQTPDDVWNEDIYDPSSGRIMERLGVNGSGYDYKLTWDALLGNVRGNINGLEVTGNKDLSWWSIFSPADIAKAMGAANTLDPNWQLPSFVSDPIQKGSKAAGMESQWNNLVDVSSSIANLTPRLMQEVLTGGGQPVLKTKAVDKSAFASLDTDGDGKITQADIDPLTGKSRFDSLKLWNDTNENGVADDGEMLSLRQLASANSPSLSRDANGDGYITQLDFERMTMGNGKVVSATDVLPTAVVIPKEPSVDYDYYRRIGLTHFEYNGAQYTISSQFPLISNDGKAITGTAEDDFFSANFYDIYPVNLLFDVQQIKYLHGGAGDDTVGGNENANEIYGGAGNDELYGYGGNDILVGGDGNNAVSGGEGNDSIFVSTLAGTSTSNFQIGHQKELVNLGGFNNEVRGGNGNDIVVGSDARDNIFGDEGDDIVYGGAGDDTISGFTEGKDAKQSLLGGESDNDKLYGEAGNDKIYAGLGDDLASGGTGNDEIQGGAGSDMLYGGEGNDRLFGQVGDDVLYGGDGDDTLVGFTGSNEAKQSLEAGESDNDKLYGGAGKDVLIGVVGDDYLDGGAGADIMDGGVGNDTYVINSINDMVFEHEGNGYDVIITSSSRVIDANVEELRLVGDAVYGVGNKLSNKIIGNGDANYLNGGQGADTLIGQGGDDVYIVDNVNDKVIEQANDGNDTIISSVSYTLGANVENLELASYLDAERRTVRIYDSQGNVISTEKMLVFGAPERTELDYMQGVVANDNSTYMGTCALTAVVNILKQARVKGSDGGEISEEAVVNYAVTNDL